MKMEPGQARETGRSEAVRVGLMMRWGKEDSRTQRGWGKPIQDPSIRVCGGGARKKGAGAVCVLGKDSLHPDSAASWLLDLEQIPSLTRGSVLSSVQWGHSPCLGGLLRISSYTPGAGPLCWVVSVPWKGSFTEVSALLSPPLLPQLPALCP